MCALGLGLLLWTSAQASVSQRRQRNQIPRNGPDGRAVPAKCDSGEAAGQFDCHECCGQADFFGRALDCFGRVPSLDLLVGSNDYGTGRP